MNLETILVASLGVASFELGCVASFKLGSYKITGYRKNNNIPQKYVFGSKCNMRVYNTYLHITPVICSFALNTCAESIDSYFLLSIHIHLYFLHHIEYEYNS